MFILNTRIHAHSHGFERAFTQLPPPEAQTKENGLQVVDDRRGFLIFKGARKAGRLCCTPDTDENDTSMKNRWMKSFPNHSVAEVAETTEGVKTKGYPSFR